MKDFWKSVESEQPAFNEDVLVYTAAGAYYVAALMEDGKSWMVGIQGLISHDEPVTHWQHLTPPRQGTVSA